MHRASTCLMLQTSVDVVGKERKTQRKKATRELVVSYLQLDIASLMKWRNIILRYTWVGHQNWFFFNRCLLINLFLKIAQKSHKQMLRYILRFRAFVEGNKYFYPSDPQLNSIELTECSQQFNHLQNPWYCLIEVGIEICQQRFLRFHPY